MNMHEPFDYLFEFLSELELEFPEVWEDCIMRMTAGWHMVRV
jgi:hypothetical protein